MEKTHERCAETGRMIQVVSAEALRAILRRAGENFHRPADFDDMDEWDIGLVDFDDNGGNTCGYMCNY